MEVVRNPWVMQSTATGWAGKSVGFVPTMGALHEGHMSLLRSCRQENDFAVASIFVNPSQFGPGEDYETYPRDVEGDMEKLRAAAVDAVFVPGPDAVYPEGFTTEVRVRELSEKLCGAFRPGHFAGVATVVTKLLNIVMPRRAYFGLKDYQQYVIIKRLAADLNMPVDIVGCPIVRERDGLAMSSRNKHLSPAERKGATVIYRCLKEAEAAIKSGLEDGEKISDFMARALKAEPLVSEVQYAGAYDPETLDGLRTVKGRAVLAVAVKMGDTRLIDNLLVG